MPALSFDDAPPEWREYIESLAAKEWELQAVLAAHGLSATSNLAPRQSITSPAATPTAGGPNNASIRQTESVFSKFIIELYSPRAYQGRVIPIPSHQGLRKIQRQNQIRMSPRPARANSVPTDAS